MWTRKRCRELRGGRSLSPRRRQARRQGTELERRRRERVARSMALLNLIGDDRLVKIKSLEAAKIMKIKWLPLGCIEANFCN